MKKHISAEKLARFCELITEITDLSNEIFDSYRIDVTNLPYVEKKIVLYGKRTNIEAVSNISGMPIENSTLKGFPDDIVDSVNHRGISFEYVH